MPSSKKPTRREFLKASSSAAIAAAATPAINASAQAEVPEKQPGPFTSEELFARGAQRTFTGESLRNSKSYSLA